MAIAVPRELDLTEEVKIPDTKTGGLPIATEDPPPGNSNSNSAASVSEKESNHLMMMFWKFFFAYFFLRLAKEGKSLPASPHPKKKETPQESEQAVSNETRDDNVPDLPDMTEEKTVEDSAA
eukprot:CAMPEP_0116845094 /NCGR_PEP_ID=MMETSP0418-20121206/13071_1 /TAXON_ID=1158023 /ORGANISM="Astrosyne radiata, Strain 13vi08-1A" /LENGTH=121 /DNA_ID=CAMNT_0004476157 /DNA_START=234 /DNA_END=599 /DNA_ORIENTATION=+